MMQNKPEYGDRYPHTQASLFGVRMGDCSGSTEEYERLIDEAITAELEGLPRPVAAPDRRWVGMAPIPVYVPPQRPVEAPERLTLALSASILPRGYATLGAKQISLIWPLGADPDDDAVEALIDQLGPYPVESKEVAPCLIPAVFKQGKEDNRTKTGRNRASDADVGTLLTYDVDRGDLAADQIRSAIGKTGLSCVFWSTWQSGGPKGNRWRLLFPLETPVPARLTYPEIWKRLAKVLESLLAEELGVDSAWNVRGQGDLQHKHGLLDHLPSPVHKHILPCFPANGGKGSNTYPWGGVKPKPEFLPGLAVPVDLQRLKSQGLGDRASRSRPRGQESRGRKAIPEIQVYSPTPDAPHVDDTIHNLAPFSARVPGPLAALDAVSRLRRDGIEVGEGSRYLTLVGAVWHLFRLGASIEEMEVAATEIVERTKNGKDRRYLETRLVEVIAQFSRDANKAEPTVTRLMSETRDRILKQHRELYRRYLRILARHQGVLDVERGGKLDHAGIARILGLDVTAIVKMRSILAESGFLSISGEGLDRRYYLLLGGES